MDIGKTLYVKSRREWRQWLARNYKTEKEIWLIYYKKSSRRPTVTVDEAVGEALCFGWIDSQIKSINHEKYASRFTPRGSNSNWSWRNLEMALTLLRDGKMTPAGIRRLPVPVLAKRTKR